jgi:transposase
MVSGFRSPEGQMLRRRGKSYSQDLRERVFAAADDGESVGRIATMLRVSVSYVSKVLSRRRLTGQKTARPQRCHVAPKLSGPHPAMLAQVTRIVTPEGVLERIVQHRRSHVEEGGTPRCSSASAASCSRVWR